MGAEQLRLSLDEGVALLDAARTHELWQRAGAATQERFPLPIRTYVIERNINYTNVCQCRCSFCAFSVSPRHGRGYTLDFPALAEKIIALRAVGGAQILLQGGMNPELPWSWYLDLLRELRRSFPWLHIHAFSPPEIAFFAQQFELDVTRVIETLRDAGLDSIPGGGAEILVDRVRRIVAPGKGTSAQWLDVMRRAHRLGMCSTATMMFGHAETVAERVEHLQQLRGLQDEALEHRERTGHGGYFTAFTCWPFQPGDTRLAGELRRTQGDWQRAGAFEQLSMTALSRLYLDNVENIQASWVTQGPQIGQLSLQFGCNDAGSLMMEENVVAAAGTSYDMQLAQLQQMIRLAGFEPQQRDYFYKRRH